MIKVFWKKFNTSYWHDISNYYSELPQWTTNLNTELLSFSMSFVNPFDENDNEIIFEVGDDICITNSEITDVIGGVLAGRISSINNLLPIAFDSVSGLWNTQQDITITNRDFSYKYLYFDIKTPTPLEDILDQIFLNFTDYEGNTFTPSVTNSNDGVLNGYTGGVIDSTNISKYINLSDNIIVESFEAKGSPLNCLVELLSSIGYYFKVKYFVEPDNTNNLNLVQQYQIFSANGIIPDNEWNIGITNDIMQSGFIINLNYINQNETPNINEYLPSEKEISSNIDGDSLVNYFMLDVLIQNGLELTNETKNVVPYQKSFQLDNPAKDIIYYCRMVNCKITSVTSSTVFTIPQAEADRLLYDKSKLQKDQLVCLIKDNTETNKYFRVFDIVGNTITLDSAIVGLDTTYGFELVNGNDIYSEDYPDLDTIQYGVVKKVRPRDKGEIECLELDIPNANNDSVSIWYYSLKNEIKKEEFPEDILKYGMFFQEETINAPITIEQYDYLKQQLLKFINPLQTISFTSYRLSPAEIGYLIPIDLKNNTGTKVIYNNSMIVTSINNRIVSNYGIDNNITIEQDITISEYRLKLQDIIKRLKKATKNNNQSNSQGVYTINVYPLLEFV